jgi:hypothetical protein
MNTRQFRIIALLVVSVGAFSQATARGLTDETQPVVEATTKAVPPQKPTPWWWEWLRFAGGRR